jgi:flagellar hook-length control protein FliK
VSTGADRAAAASAPGTAPGLASALGGAAATATAAGASTAGASTAGGSAVTAATRAVGSHALAAQATAAGHDVHGGPGASTPAVQLQPASADGTQSAGATTGAGTARPLPTIPGVRLAEAAETVATTIELAARQGVTQARIELAPASLGTIQIHLQHTSDGLVARVITEHPDAAATMNQNADDLRRQFASHGMALLRLDIESSDKRNGSGQDGAGSGSGADDGDDGDGGPAAVGTETTTLHLTGSTALVNVLA